MTIEQQRALAKAYLILEKNFDHSVIIICQKEIPGSSVQPDPIVCWSGGLIPAKHLVLDAVTKIERRKVTRSVPSVSQEIIEEIMKEI